MTTSNSEKSTASKNNATTTASVNARPFSIYNRSNWSMKSKKPANKG